MTPELNKIYIGRCEETISSWPDNFIDACVCDPPYELGFMGKAWDSTGIAYSVPMWSQVLRVLKPGGHLLAFSGTRTYHRMACAIEDSGFQIRDQIQWLYGSGFPKSLNIDKALDKASGKADERGYIETTGGLHGGSGNTVGKFTGRQLSKNPVTEDAKKWAGWGTALKPANEPICMARKPLSEATVAANIVRWGTGALNIEASKIGEEARWSPPAGNTGESPASLAPVNVTEYAGQEVYGRWPANILFDQYAAGVLDGKEPEASRFFYVAKPDTGERDSGLEGEELITPAEITGRKEGSAGLNSPRAGKMGASANSHPTVKPVDIMAYLIQLVTPGGGLVLDPFMGSGTTGMAAARLGNPFLGCEMSKEYITIAEKRIASELQQGKLF